MSDFPFRQTPMSDFPIRQLDNGNVLNEVSNTTCDWLLGLRANPEERLDSVIERLLDAFVGAMEGDDDD